jgi:SecD/SecF fusion protein
MKNKGFVQVFSILLVVVCAYQLSFTLRGYQVEQKAKSIAKKTNRSLRDVLDSLGPEKVYNLGIANYTFTQVKERELNLGLDLQGGMNVTLEVSVPEIVKAMADNSTDNKFNEAMSKAEGRFLGEVDFIDLFKEEYEKLSPNKGLATVFMRKELKDIFNYSSPNSDVYNYLKDESKKSVDRAYQILSTRIDKFGVTQPNIQQLDGGRILVELPGVDDPSRIRRVLQSSAKLEFWNTYPNYDGFKFLEEANKRLIGVLGIDTTGGKEEKSSGLSLTGTSATDSNATSSTGSLSGNDSTSAAKDTAQKSAEQIKKENPLLSLVYPNITQDGKNWSQGAAVGFVLSKDKSTVDSFLTKYDEVKGAMPNDVRFRWSFKPSDKEGRFFMLYALKASKDGRPALEGDVVTDARPSMQPNGEIKVSMSMNQDGARDWKRVTAKASQTTEAVAIVLDDQVYSAPTVQTEIPDGRSEISGGFDQNEAGDLSNILKAGKLPAPARIVEEGVVGPTLGKAAIRAGLISLLVGFLCVIAFMIWYYGKPGVYSVVALLANLFFIIGVLSGYGAALTLPGMAGLVLTIGMAVDANVLIYERVKEEVASGKGIKAAVQNGYSAALSSIIDANITTLIAGFVLMAFGRGAVAGFAIILVIGILSSLFTAIFLTRLFIERDLDKGKEIAFDTNLSKKMFSNSNIDFIGNRKKFYIVSSIIIVAGIVSLFTKGVSTGVDFKGGWSYIIQMDNKVSAQDIKSALNASKLPNEVKTYGTNDQFKITTTYLIDSKDINASEQVQAAVLKSLSALKVQESNILTTAKVGPTIAEDIKTDSAMAVVFAIIGMFFYIVVRFRKWSFGLGAVVALFHDVMMVFSVYSIFWGILPFPMDIDQAFIAAILTVIGYSINDTVVVFDRVREFLHIHRHESDTPDVINNAINQTLSRTLVTSFTTLLVVLILFLFGGEGLKGFTFALLIGIGVGTYSSICIATPIVVDFFKKEKK